MQIFSTQLVACVAACMAIIPSVAAAPIARGHSCKRIVLWDWTNTRDVSSYPGIQTSANSISTASKVWGVVNWGTYAPEEIGSGVRFQPMIRTLAELEGDAWNAAVTQAQNHARKIIHTFNEPEMNGISTDAAVAAWRSQLVPLRAQTGAMLVSPAPASNDAGSAWLADFMSKLADNEKPDIIGTHFYTNADSPAETEIAAAKSYLQARISTYGLPLAVSEIGSTSRDATSVQTFTEEMANWMDSNNMVQIYGFFGASRQTADSFVSPAAQLMDSNGEWTALGNWLLNA